MSWVSNSYCSFYKCVGLQGIRKTKQTPTNGFSNLLLFLQDNLRSIRLDCLNPKCGLFPYLECSLFSIYKIYFPISGSCHMEASKKVMLNFMVLLREVIEIRAGWVTGWRELRPLHQPPVEDLETLLPSWRALHSGSLWLSWIFCAFLRGKVWDWDLHMVLEDMATRTST